MGKLELWKIHRGLWYNRWKILLLVAACISLFLEIYHLAIHDDRVNKVDVISAVVYVLLFIFLTWVIKPKKSNVIGYFQITDNERHTLPDLLPKLKEKKVTILSVKLNVPEHGSSRMDLVTQGICTMHKPLIYASRNICPYQAIKEIMDFPVTVSENVYLQCTSSCVGPVNAIIEYETI